MAVSIAQAGARVLLVDCDLRNPSLSRTLAPDARCGFLEVLDGDVTLADAVWQDPVTKLDFLPTISGSTVPRSNRHFFVEAAEFIFQDASDQIRLRHRRLGTTCCWCRRPSSSAAHRFPCAGRRVGHLPKLTRWNTDFAMRRVCEKALPVSSSTRSIWPR